MENIFHSESFNNNEESLVITPQARIFLRETAKWAKFLSILGFIILFFMIVSSFFIGAIITSIYGTMGEAMAPSWSLTLFYIVIICISGVPLYFLYQFANKIQAALDSNDTSVLTDSFKFLKSYYKFIGIFTIIILSIYAIFFILMLIGVTIGGLSAL